MTRPTISVIIPAHPARAKNGMLQRALESVYTQTVQPDAIITAIDVDREGAAPTRHRALMSATTDLVAFLDSDDAFLPRHLELLRKHLLEREADFVYSWFKVMQVNSKGEYNILEDDPIFPVTHYLDPFDPTSEETMIETTITTMVRTDIAQAVGFQALDRGEANSGEDRRFTVECAKRGAKISHLVRKTWLWTHWELAPGVAGNTGGLPIRGDAALG